MASIDNIVRVTITHQTSFPSVRDLSTALIIANEYDTEAPALINPVGYNIYEYPDHLTALTESGFVESDFVYKAVSILFQQAVKPRRVVVTTKLPEDDYSTALVAQAERYSQFGYVITDADDDADWLAISAACESLERIHVFTTDNVDVVNAVSGNIFEQLSALNYRFTHYAYNSNEAGTVPAAGIVGRYSPEPEGSITWRMKTIIGMSADKLSATQEVNLKAVNASWYTRINDVDVYIGDAKVASGEYVDVVLGDLWVRARMQERVFGTKLNTRKINMDNGGAALIQSDVQSVLSEAVERNIYASSPAPYVKVPNVLALSPSQRNSRVLPAVEFRARLAGAVHETDIAGTVYP
jgi:hypothetical protein